MYGVVLPDPKGGSSSEEDDDSDDSSEASRLPSSAAQQKGKGNVPGIVRPPAIVTEFMSQGSLKGALQRKADIVQGALMRVLIAMDAAKVCKTSDRQSKAISVCASAQKDICNAF